LNVALIKNKVVDMVVAQGNTQTKTWHRTTEL
jgi:hypothetical protein